MPNEKKELRSIDDSKIEVSETTENAFLAGGQARLPGSDQFTEDLDQDEEEESTGRTIGRFAKTIGIFAGIIIFVLFFFNFVVKTYQVDGTSMTPTLQHNDRLLVFAFGKTWSNLTGGKYIPKRGEVVIINLPNNEYDMFGEDIQLVKRVIGLPGDRISLKNEQFLLFNDEHPDGIDPNELLGLELAPTSGESNVTVPEDHIYVVGDNRVPGGSHDSRAYDVGPIHIDEITGTAFFRFLPVGKWNSF